MYLVKLYMHQKKNFLLLVIFFITSILVNYKSGIIATPINLYGMFSGAYSMADTLTINNVYIDGVPINYTKYSYEKRDLMIGMLDNYLAQEKSNKNIFETFKKLIQKINASINISYSTFTNKTDNNDFKKWYGRMLTKICKKSITQFAITSQKYVWNGKALTPLGTAVQIMNYVPQ